MKVRAIHWLSLLPLALFGCERGNIHVDAPGINIDSNGSHFTASGDFSKLGTEGTGPVSTQDKTIDDFHALSVDSAINVEFSKSDKTSVEISARQSVLSSVTAKVTDGTLHLGLNGIFRNPGPVNIKVSGPNLDAIETSGGSTVKCTGTFSNDLAVTADGASKVDIEGSANKITLALSGAGTFNAKSLESAAIAGTIDGSSEARLSGNIKDVDLSLSGAANAHIDGIDADDCKLTLDGGSELEASGQAKSLKVTASGAATAHLPSLVAQECEAEADGGSQVHVNAVKSLKANASGGSEIGYTGKPMAISRESDSGASVQVDN